MSKTFVGPSRRHDAAPPPGIEDRRTPRAAKPHSAGTLNLNDTPQIWMPNYALKKKLGGNKNLETLIPANVLDKAQSAINEISETSLSWIKEDMTRLTECANNLNNTASNKEIPGILADIALNIKSRAGTFGFPRAAEVAYLLYLFCRSKLQPNHPEHRTIVKKHIEVLQVIFGNNLRGDASAFGEEIIKGLKSLTKKFGA